MWSYRHTLDEEIKRFLDTGESTLFNSRIEITALRRDGSEFPIELSIAPVRSANYVGFSAFIRDITKRRQIQETFRESEERFRSAIDHAPIGMALVALNGHFLKVNRSLCQILGHTESELLSKDFQSITHPDDLEADPEYVRQMIEGEINSYQIEKRFFHKTGRVVRIFISCSLVHDQAGKPLYFIAQIQDITERKESEEKLRLNEALLRTIIDSTPDWIFIKDRNHRYLLVNKSYASSMGQEPDYFVGKTDIDIGFPEAIVKGDAEKGIRGFWADDREVMDTGRMKVIEEEPAVVNDEEVILSTVKVPLKDVSGWVWGILGFVHDITARKRSEAALKQSERDYRGLFENAHDAILVVNPEDEVVLDVNQRACEIYGFSQSEFIGMSLIDISHDVARGRVYLEKALSESAFQSFETVQYRKDGSKMFLEIHASVVNYKGQRALLSINSDISERKQVEEQLRRSEERFRALLESASEAIIAVDINGIITLANRMAERVFGYDRGELTGQWVSTLVPSRLREEDVNHRDESFADKDGKISSRELFGLRKNGEEFPMILSISIINTADGKVSLGFISDVTERKQAEILLREAKESAEVANRAKGEFLANMSHEIRTPMNAVMGMTGLLLDTELSPEQHEFVEVIRTSSDSLLTIINDILDFSKIESGRLEMEDHPFDLRDSIEESLDLLAANAAEKNLNLAYTVDPQVPATITGDATRLRQILVNLINNAVKFTEAGEIIVSVTSRQVREGTHYVEASPDHQSHSVHELHFVVKDTGIGIPGDRIDRLFRSFSQVDASTTRLFGGTGLGLAISKRLAELMGGTMWVESEFGKGSNFHFTIQAATVPSQARDFLRSTQPELKGRRLLIVDSNSINRRILESQAQSWGMIPFLAKSGEEALAWIRRGDPFDAAILDIQESELDCLQLALAIHKLHNANHLPLIMLTSVSRLGKEDQEGIFSAFLTKPIKPANLYEALMSIFAATPSRSTKHELSKRGFTAMGQEKPLKILLVEDNVINQKVASKILERMGYRLDIAGNGLEAIEALDRQHYDVVFMDVQMPEMDGLTATREICRKWSKAQRPRIIAMTANAMQGDREECLVAGMDDYISKPLRIDELASALERSFEDAVSDDDSQQLSEEEAQAAIDFSFLEAVYDTSIENDRESLAQLAQLYLEDAGAQIAELKELLRLDDTEAIRKLAHALKGGSASLGASRMAELCLELEGIARKGSLEGAIELINRMTIEFARVRQAFDSRKLLKNQMV